MAAATVVGEPAEILAEAEGVEAVEVEEEASTLVEAPADLTLTLAASPVLAAAPVVTALQQPTKARALEAAPVAAAPADGIASAAVKPASHEFAVAERSGTDGVSVHEGADLPAGAFEPSSAPDAAASTSVSAAQAPQGFELPAGSREWSAIPAAAPAVGTEPLKLAERPLEPASAMPVPVASVTFVAQAEQVTARLFADRGEDTTRLTIELDPAELGSVEVALKLDDRGFASATFTVERPETLQLLQRDARYLVDLLAGAGFSIDAGNLGFELRQEQQDARQQPPGTPERGRQDGGDGRERPRQGEAPPAPRRGLLDLRV